MSMEFSKKGALAFRVAGLSVRSSAIGPMGRLDVLSAAVDCLRSTCRHERSIRVGDGTMYLDPCHDSDWNVFEDIFVRLHYQCDFAGRCVIDVGAHKGLFSAFALSRGASLCLAYEPEPNNFALLAKTRSSFHGAGTQFRAYPLAVTADGEAAELKVAEYSSSHSLVIRPNRRVVSCITVQATSFSDVLAQARTETHAMSGILVKIDAEGSEFDILLHSPSHAFAFVSEAIVEFHGDVGGDREEVVSRLSSLGLHLTPGATIADGTHSLMLFRRSSI